MKKQNKTGSIGVVSATAIGVGGMMGAGLYTLLGLSANSAGVWLPVSFLIGGIVAAFSVYSYSKLGMKYPDRGGAAKFLLKEFGDGLLAGGMNVFQYIGWIITMALYATGFAEYACQLLGKSSSGWLGKAISIGIVIVVVAINIMGSKQVARAQTAIIAFELLILLSFVAVGLTKLHVPTITSSNSGNIVGILSAAGLLYVTYEGFGVVTNAAGSMVNPKKQLPQALFFSLGIVMVIYIVASVVVVMTLGVQGAVANQGHVLATAGKLVLGNWGLFITSLIVCIFVVIFPLSAVGEMASLAFLLVYAMVKLGHLRIAGQTGAKRWILICSVVLNLALFALLFIQTILNHETLTWISVIALLIISFLVELAWRKKNKRNLHWLGKNSNL
ncbi:amino acid permease [Lactobacillus crispatus]|jgi:amino acid transporter|uniref:Amino acid permease n=1 Tax=Lactobacillus crispatus TaxID=47770 RepID=A0A2M9WLK7_9LACO|nr:APC family permease [Lactobacillus crispatus]PJZ16000.1 amino acid permease [Lactobacillus crispatus]